MTTWNLIGLNFGRNTAHFGETGIGIEQTSERVRSDTLFSAWMSAYARLFGKEAIETLLNQFLHSSIPFHLSSTFIYRCKNNNYTYYLPKPLALPKDYPSDDLKFSKTYKKLNYLPLSVWQRWYQESGWSEADTNELTDTTNKKNQEDKPLHLAGVFDYSNTFTIYTTPKVAIDRITSATNFYHTGLVQFECQLQTHSGLYFLLYFPNPDSQLEQDLKAALNLLAEEGIGGERSSGAGRFIVEWSDLPPQWQKVIHFKKANAYSLVSLLWDDTPPKITLNSRYDFLERGGWIGSAFSGKQLRRQMVRMFTEGSIFPTELQGKLADVTPHQFKTHKIYRSGISLSLPVCL